MNNDLISREALKEATKSFVDCDGFNPVWQIIDSIKAYNTSTNDKKTNPNDKKTNPNDNY